MGSITVGVPKERKTGEMRVGLTPQAVADLRKLGAEVLVEAGAGWNSGYSGAEYVSAGGVYLKDPADIFRGSDLVVKVKELLPDEYEHLALMRRKTLFHFSHLAGVDPRHTFELLMHEVTDIAFELVRAADGTLPILIPMSDIAGREAMRQAFRHFASRGLVPMRVVIFGAGVSGGAALEEALRGKAHVTLFDRDEKKLKSAVLRHPKDAHRISVRPVGDEGLSAEDHQVLLSADVVISAVMVAGREAPMVLSERDLRHLKHGAFVFDIAIDQGGSTAWTRNMPTLPGQVWMREGIYLSATPNIPGSSGQDVARDATDRLARATMFYTSLMVKRAMELSASNPQQGIHFALKECAGLRAGLATFSGFVTNWEIAAKHGLTGRYQAPSELI